MIAVKDRFLKLTPEEYFIWEEQQLLRHEYLSGRVYAMSGGTQNHGRIASNIIFILKGHLRGGGCQVGNSDCRVNIFETKDYVYPDVSVTCDDRDRTAIQAIQYPCLIIEVLSDSTQRKDRTSKRWAYQNLPSLLEYVLIEQDFVDIEVSRRSINWQSQHYFLGNELFFESLDLKVPVADIYRRVDNEDMREFLQVNEDESPKN